MVLVIKYAFWKTSYVDLLSLENLLEQFESGEIPACIKSQDIHIFLNVMETQYLDPLAD